MKTNLIDQMMALQQELEQAQQNLRGAEDLDAKLGFSDEITAIIRRMNQIRVALNSQDQAELFRLHQQQSQGKY